MAGSWSARPRGNDARPRALDGRRLARPNVETETASRDRRARAPTDRTPRRYSVVYTDRALNHMSEPFQHVMTDLHASLTAAYNADHAVLLPGSGTYAMEAAARAFGDGRLLLERALLLAAQLEDEALEGRRVVVDEAALAVPLLARPALAAGAPRLALLDLAAAPRALGAALALAHRALVLRSEALSAPLAV